jgi:hypothetical protein
MSTNFTVTDGIFIDENTIFDKVTPEWIEYCRTVLGLNHPADFGGDAGPAVKDTGSD